MTNNKQEKEIRRSLLDLDTTPRKAINGREAAPVLVNTDRFDVLCKRAGILNASACCPINENGRLQPSNNPFQWTQQALIEMGLSAANIQATFALFGQVKINNDFDVRAFS